MINPTIILRPFSALYGLILKFRHRLYDKGVLVSSSGPVTTIVVGNLELGGTGKSPLTDHILSVLESEFSIGLLSRGYGRKTDGFLEIMPGATAEQVGDEPLMLSNAHQEIKAAVSEDRIKGLEQLTQKYPLDIVVLDDAFQHRKLNSGFNILVTTFDRPFWTNHLIPEGTLRDVKKRARAAHIVIISKCPDQVNDKEQLSIKEKVKWYTTAPVFFTRTVYAPFQDLEGREVKALPTKDILIFTGIADDTSLVEFLSQEHEILHVAKYRDHHQYSTADMRKLKQICTTFGGRQLTLVTTAKDAVKLRGEAMRKELDGVSIYVIPIRLEFLNEGFDEITESYARANKRDR